MSYTQAVFPQGLAPVLATAQSILESANDLVGQVGSIREGLSARLAVARVEADSREQAVLEQYDRLAANVEASFELPDLLKPFDHQPVQAMKPVQSVAPARPAMPALPTAGGPAQKGMRHR